VEHSKVENFDKAVYSKLVDHNANQLSVALSTRRKSMAECNCSRLFNASALALLVMIVISREWDQAANAQSNGSRVALCHEADLQL
jgi:hypothetical protein